MPDTRTNAARPNAAKLNAAGLNDRDRFIAFAFAAAELLVETGPEGQIVWAGGAFASRLGAPGEAFLGQPVHNLVSPTDRPALRRAVSQASLQGRLSPIVVHLADPHRTACALGALALPGAGGRLCVTFAALPAPPAPVAPRVGDRAELGREAEASTASASSTSPWSGWARAPSTISRPCCARCRTPPAPAKACRTSSATRKRSACPSNWTWPWWRT